MSDIAPTPTIEAVIELIHRFVDLGMNAPLEIVVSPGELMALHKDAAGLAVFRGQADWPITESRRGLVLRTLIGDCLISCERRGEIK